MANFPVAVFGISGTGSDSPGQPGEFTAQLALKTAVTPDLPLGPAPLGTPAATSA